LRCGAAAFLGRVPCNSICSVCARDSKESVSWSLASSNNERIVALEEKWEMHKYVRVSAAPEIAPLPRLPPTPPYFTLPIALVVPHAPAPHCDQPTGHRLSRFSSRLLYFFSTFGWRTNTTAHHPTRGRPPPLPILVPPAVPSRVARQGSGGGDERWRGVDLPPSGKLPIPPPVLFFLLTQRPRAVAAGRSPRGVGGRPPRRRRSQRAWRQRLAS